MGTGTTCIAAANWGRNSIGIDVEPTYHQLALTRMQQTYGLRVVYNQTMEDGEQ